MAFNDIKAWREIMDAEEQEKIAYDKACEDAEARAASAEQEEYDGIDQPQVDPSTMECPLPGRCACLDDLEDDEVDFSAYGISEADLGVGPADGNYPTASDLAREPLVRIPAAAGRPASDADLAAQDVVSLMAEALKKARGLGEAGEAGGAAPTEYHGEFGSDLLACINGMDEQTFENATVRVDVFFDGKSSGPGRANVTDLYRDGKITVARLSNSQVTRLSKFLDLLKIAHVSKLSDVVALDLNNSDAEYGGFEWNRIRNDILIKFNKKTDPNAWKKKYGDFLNEKSKAEFGDFLSEEEGAPEVDGKIEQMEADDDYPLSDADWDEINAEESYQKKIEMVQAKVRDRWDSLSAESKRKVRADVEELRKELLRSGWSKRQFEKAVRLQQMSRERELSDKEKEQFAYIVRFCLDDEQRGRLERNLYANGYPASRHGVVTHVPYSDAQSDNVRNYHQGENAAERSNEDGLDTEFDISKFAYVPEPMAPGTKIPADFNPEYGPDQSIHGRVKDLVFNKKQLDQTRDEFKQGIERDKLARSVGDEFIDNPAVWKRIVGALDPDEIQEITQELANELPGPKADNQRMLDYMFGGMKLTQVAVGAQAGYGADQGGRTGGLTQQGDKLMNLLLFSLAQYLNICQDPVDITVQNHTKHYDSKLDALWKNLRSENTAQREARKILRPMFLNEICSELDVDLSRVAQELGGVTPAYSAGVKAKRAADNLLISLFVREYDNMSADDRQQLAQTFQNYRRGAPIVKLYTGLDNDQNSEFQDLLHRMRDEGDLPDEDRVRLVQLDIIRLHPGTTEDQARARANQEYARMTQNGDGPFVEYSTRLAKRFLRGHSTNVTRDTITVPDRARG